MKQLTLFFLFIAQSLLIAQSTIKFDSTFNNIGYAEDFSEPAVAGCSFSTTAIQSDNKIVAVGGRNGNYFMARYLANGTLDNSFGVNGSSSFDTGYATGVFELNDGKIWVSGHYSDSLSWTNYFISRHLLNGLLDSTFGINGRINFIQSGDEYNLSSILQSDGKMLIAGNTSPSDFSTTWIDIIRININGQIDSTFGTNGKVSFNVYSFANFSSFKLLPNGKIMVLGISSNNATNIGYACLMRYNTNGTLDSTFAINGVSFIPVTYPSFNFTDFDILADSSIMICGFSNNPILMHCQPNGLLDTNFGTNGEIIYPIENGTDTFAYTEKMVLLSDNSLLISLSTFDGLYNYVNRPLLKVNANGIIDSTFAQNGLFHLNLGAIYEYIASMQFQNDGKLLLAGSLQDNTNQTTFIGRLLLDLNTGILDFDQNTNQAFVYPNPIKENATLSYELIKNEEISIHLYDTEGRLLHSFIEKETQTNGKHSQNLNFEGLATGHYILSIEGKVGRTSVKVLKE